MGIYFVGQPSRGVQLVWNRPAAIRTAQRLARRTGRVAHIHRAVGSPRGHIGFEVGPLLAIVAPNGAMEYQGAIGGMGDILTDMACSDTHIARTWRDRNNATIAAGTQAAIVGAAAAGLVGAIIGPRGGGKAPILGALAGAAIGWAGYAVWTAPYQISGQS